MLVECLRRIGRQTAWLLFRGARLLWPPAWTREDCEVFFSLVAIAIFFFLGGVFYMFTDNSKDAADLDLSDAHREKLIKELMKERGWELVREEDEEENIIKPDTYIDEIEVDVTRKPRYKIVNPKKEKELEKKKAERLREEKKEREREMERNRAKKESQEVVQLKRDNIRRKPIDNQLDANGGGVNKMYKKKLKKQPPLPPTNEYMVNGHVDKMEVNKKNVVANREKMAVIQNNMDAYRDRDVAKQENMANNQKAINANVYFEGLQPTKAENEKNLSDQDGLVLKQRRQEKWQQQKHGYLNKMATGRNDGVVMIKNNDKKVQDSRMVGKQQDIRHPKVQDEPSKDRFANIKMSKYKKVPKLMPGSDHGEPIVNLQRHQNASQFGKVLLQNIKNKPKLGDKMIDNKGKKFVKMMNKRLSQDHQSKQDRYEQSQKVYVNKDAEVYDLSQDINEDYECLFLNMKPSTKVCLYPVTQDVHISYHIREEGNWEPHIVQGMQNELYSNPDIGLIDIGANIGLYSLIAANMGHKVVAVEPYIENIKHLQMAAKLNNATDKIVLLQNAISDERHRLKLELPPDNQGGVAINKGESCTPGAVCHETSTIFMDDLVNFVTFPKAIIKIDIEGHEHKAFRRAAKLFDEIYIPSVYMEWRNLRSYYGAEITDTVDKSLTFDLVGFFVSRNYSAFSHVTGARLKPGIWFSWPDDIVWRHQ